MVVDDSGATCLEGSSRSIGWGGGGDSSGGEVEYGEEKSCDNCVWEELDR